VQWSDGRRFNLREEERGEKGREGESEREQEARTLEYENPGNPPQLEVTLLCGGGGGAPPDNCATRHSPARLPLSLQLRRYNTFIAVVVVVAAALVVMIIITKFNYIYLRAN
jgi:hypothetical protein